MQSQIFIVRIKEGEKEGEKGGEESPLTFKSKRAVPSFLESDKGLRKIEITCMI